MQTLFDFVIANRVWLALYWTVSSVLFGLYIKSTGYAMWYIACVPVANLWVKHELGGCNIVILVVQAYCTIMLFITGLTYLTLLALLLKVGNDYCFANCMLNESSPKLFAFVPLAKYILMFKEARHAGI